MMNSRLQKLLATGLCLSALGMGSGMAQADEAASVTMKPVRVSLFKNGYGFITMRGKTCDAASMELKNLPVPAFGTFWISASNPAKIACLVSSKKKSQVPMWDAGMMDVANANPGKQIRVVTDNGIVEGTVMSLSEERSKEAESNPYMIGGVEEKVNSQAFFNMPDGGGEGRLNLPSFLIVRTPSGSVAVLSRDRIKQLEFADAHTRLPMRDVETPCVELVLEKPVPGAILTATSVAAGISWIPSYHLDMTNPGKAVMSVKASVMNELMDMEGVKLDLITGVPTLKYPWLPSPLSMKMNLNGFLSGLSENAPRGSMLLGQQRSAMMSNVFIRSDAGAISADSFSGPGAPLGTVRTEDLFYYPVENFTCKRNETVTFPLFSGEVPYKTVYTWEIPDQRVLARYSEQESNTSQDPSRDIWHCIRLENTFNLPLTTGVIEFTSGNRFAGQGTLMFTGSREMSTVRLNKSMDIVTERSEKIMERREVPDNKNRTLNVVYGTLEVRNLSGKDVPLEVTKKVLGVPQSASEGGVCTTEPNWTGNSNPNGTIKWNLTIPSDGKPVTVTYFYDYVD